MSVNNYLNPSPTFLFYPNSINCEDMVKGVAEPVSKPRNNLKEVHNLFFEMFKGLDVEKITQRNLKEFDIVLKKECEVVGEGASLLTGSRILFPRIFKILMNVYQDSTVLFFINCCPLLTVNGDDKPIKWMVQKKDWDFMRVAVGGMHDEKYLDCLKSKL